MKSENKLVNLPLQNKLIAVYCLTALLILIVNLFMYSNINSVLHRLDRIYVSNINLN